ncbi:ATP-dependent zinc metalloprotease FtsH [Eubacterium sp. F2]|uniref:ATP-dependent zinc metalloprotease FtsH n=1 Tax=Eubacterium sp. F2 TaxID=3381348 RepID=UPI0039081E49
MKKFARNLVIYLVIFGIVMGVAYFVRNGGTSQQEVALSTMAKYLKNGKVTEVTIKDSKVTAQIGKNKQVYAYANSALELDWLEQKYIYNKVDSGDIVLRASGPDHASALMNALPTIIMVVALGFLFYIMMNQGGNGKAFQFGKNRAHMYKGEGKKITFADVAGLKEEKEELQEVVDFLKDPRKYNEVGARIPKGILLVGPPGTGKTYVSRATAGEAGVPFFTISGSDFVEMFVGVGASRVRDLFDQAKKNAPCIIFIDEIDAVGRKRGAGLGGGNDEREQTLNQLLVEMDGFSGNSGIIILAATNRPDILDPALLRPGRFDRQITIGVPDVKGREEIIRIHAKNKPLSDEVSPEIIARRTPGFTPADLENLLNEAALITARRNGRWIRMAEIEEATTKVMAGPAKKSRVISEKEKRLTAYHEAGHAIVMRSIPGSDPVHQITIIPRGQAGGFTMSLPTEDKYFMTKNDMMHEIMHLLGGRVAESIYLDDISTGASNDIERATQIARSMVTKYGFSDRLGPINYADSDEPFLGRDFSKTKAYSEEVANEIDEEVRRLVGDCYAKTEAILKEHSAEMERVAEALIRVETLDAEQFEDLYTGKEDPESTERKVREHEEEIRRVNKAEAEESRRIRKAEDARAEEMREAVLNGDKLSDDQVRHLVADQNGHIIDPYAQDKTQESKSNTETGEEKSVSEQDTISKESNAAASEDEKTDSQDDNGGIDEE